MSSSAKEIFNEFDSRLFIDFYGFDKLNSKILIGQYEASLIEIIQQSKKDEERRSLQQFRLLTQEKRVNELKQLTLASNTLQKSSQAEQPSGKSLLLEQE